MTLVSAIITAAYRETNLVPIVSTPSTAEQTEGLARLSSLLLSSIGNEAGQDLHDLTVGGTYDQSQYLSSWVPENARLILNLTAARSFNLHPSPYEGQRIAIADAGANLGTYNLTLAGNGRQIEGSSSLTLSTNGTNRQWMYRADTGNWVRISSLSLSDQMPFPEEYDDFFITMLALRLNPRHNAKLSAESTAALQRSKGQIRARYRRPRSPPDMPSDFLNGRGGRFGLGIADFNAGRTR